MDMLCEAQRRVHAGTWTHARLENLEKGCGFSANPHGLLANVSLRAHFRVMSVATYDWMHCALQNGVLTEELFLYAKAFRPVGHSAKDIETFLRDGWQFPTCTRNMGNLHHVFDAYRSRSSDKANHLKASAGELLGLYGMLRHFAATHVGDHPALAGQRASFEAGCHVIDLILQAKRGIIPLPDAAVLMKDACKKHLALTIAAYGDDHVKPKHHWMLDFAEQLSTKPCILDAFIIERLHLRAKRHADRIFELGVLERSTMAGIVNDQFDEASKPLRDGLRGAVSRFDGSLIADRLTVGALRIGIDDVVFMDRTAAIVAVCAEEDGVLFCIVREMGCVGTVAVYFFAAVDRYILFSG